MSSESSSDRVRVVLLAVPFVAILIFGMIMGVTLTMQDDDAVTYQGVLHIGNWTNRTLNMTVFVYGNDWATIGVALNHTENVTLTLTWQDVKETVVFLYSVGRDIVSTTMYTLEAGQWRSILLV